VSKRTKKLIGLTVIDWFVWLVLRITITNLDFSIYSLEIQSIAKIFTNATEIIGVLLTISTILSFLDDLGVLDTLKEKI
jgi:hypothetical protein